MVSSFSIPTVDNRWNDLPLKPSFLPLFHEIVRYLTRYNESRGWYALGEAIPVVGRPPEVSMRPSSIRRNNGTSSRKPARRDKRNFLRRKCRVFTRFVSVRIPGWSR